MLFRIGGEESGLISLFDWVFGLKRNLVWGAALEWAVQSTWSRSTRVDLEATTIRKHSTLHSTGRYRTFQDATRQRNSPQQRPFGYGIPGSPCQTFDRDVPGQAQVSGQVVLWGLVWISASPRRARGRMCLAHHIQGHQMTAVVRGRLSTSHCLPKLGCGFLFTLFRSVPSGSSFDDGEQGGSVFSLSSVLIWSHSLPKSEESRGEGHPAANHDLPQAPQNIASVRYSTYLRYFSHIRSTSRLALRATVFFKPQRQFPSWNTIWRS